MLFVVQLLIPALILSVTALVLYWVVRRAIVSGMRQARHEARVERYLPKAATWLTIDERDLVNTAHKRS